MLYRFIERLLLDYNIVTENGFAPVTVIYKTYGTRVFGTGFPVGLTG